MTGIRWKVVGKKAVQKGLWPLIRFFILFGICFLLVYPLLFMISSAFRSQEDLWDPSVVWITRHFSLEHFKAMMEFIDFPEALRNSILISVGTALLQTGSCAMVGYGFARFRFKGREGLFVLVLLTIIVPQQTILNPIFMMFRFFHIPVVSLFTGSVNLLNTPFPYWIQGLLGSGIRAGLFIFIYRQFFRGMPQELEEAAMIDGCNAYSTFLRIMLPSSVMIMVTVFMFSLVWHWNDTVTAGVLSANSKTLAVALTNLREMAYYMTGGGDENPMLTQARVQAGALLAILPMLIVFALGQKTFTESVERTGIVG